ncbi:MAG: hypothetical protein ACN6NY_01345 [Acinetobacter faecalis]|uniref:hypothetical protein n=1 Tax=Acinetobacter faecalis TaxID=2665161 RepID=UPI002A91E8FD|nr:hypothetical protein [Acinetobacter faecalis]MDY6509621.1 hypothetical protein [Acinetobacter faecalis]
MNIMFLMGGVRSEVNMDDYPLYMTEINEKTILEQQVYYTQKIQPQKLLFCIHELDIKKFYAEAVIKQIDPESVIIPIKAQTKGAICSALLGAEYIDNDSELILMAISDFVDDDCLEIVSKFREAKVDAGVVSFTSIHPRYSFVKTTESDEILEFSEKLPISKNALVSFYYFKKGKDFVECAKDVIRKDNLVQGQFFISQTLNEMILKQKKIAIHKISNDRFHPLKTEQQVAEYLLELNEKRVLK